MTDTCQPHNQGTLIFRYHASLQDDVQSGRWAVPERRRLDNGFRTFLVVRTIGVAKGLRRTKQRYCLYPISQLMIECNAGLDAKISSSTTELCAINDFFQRYCASGRAGDCHPDRFSYVPEASSYSNGSCLTANASRYIVSDMGGQGFPHRRPVYSFPRRRSWKRKGGPPDPQSSSSG